METIKKGVLNIAVGLFIFPIVLFMLCNVSQHSPAQFIHLKSMLYPYYSKSGAGNHTCSKLNIKNGIFPEFFYQIFNDAAFFLEKSEFLPDLNKFASDGTR